MFLNLYSDNINMLVVLVTVFPGKAKLRGKDSQIWTWT